MLRPACMMQLSVLILERDERAVVHRLGELGGVELVPVATEEGGLSRVLQDLVTQLGRCDRLLTRVAELRRTLNAPRAQESEVIGEMTFTDAELTLRGIEERLGTLLGYQERLQRQLTHLEETCAVLAPYRGLEVPVQHLSGGEFVHCVFGRLPIGRLPELPPDLLGFLVPLPEEGRQQPIIAVTTRRAGAALDRVLQQVGFEQEDFPAFEGVTPKSAIVDAERQRTETIAELEQVEAELQGMAAESTRRLSAIELWTAKEKRVVEARQSFVRTESTVLIHGWVPADGVSGLRGHLETCTKGRCVMETRAPCEGSTEAIPVLLRSACWLRPFEMLVTAYGLPRYGELIPTPFVAVSFLIMFGMMFGDVGHGGLLALGGWVGWFAGRTLRVRYTGVLLLFCGVSSAAFGVVYGSVFGLPQMKRYALWHDPLEGDPIVLMQLAIALGVVLMSLGLVLNVVNRLRCGDWLDGVFGKCGLAGMLFYWSAVVLAVRGAVLSAYGWFFWACGLCLGLPLVAWVLKEPLASLRTRSAHPEAGSEGILAALAESLVGAFEGVLLYLANTVSFVRLAAYAMSHAALLTAAFALAAEFRGLAVGGMALSVAVIILGNGIAVVLEGIVAGVQALRLEYYEFFGKFFSGEGQPFQPFSLAVQPGWR